ncbi:MAG: MBL fold metallo-hydrolase [Candidatus Bathyarchaeia archaeon]|jgi:glyoxylase-like metal-dependent hydrolase (beta-lactamase superfamily II)
MHTKQIGRNLYQIDLETGGIKNLIASYVIKTAKKTMLIESGPTNSVPNLLCGLAELKVNPEDVDTVAVTHIHLDHGGGAGTLLKHLPNAKVLVHPKGLPHMVNPEKLWPSSQSVLGFVAEVFGKPEPVPQDRITPVTEGVIELGDGGKLTIFESLGHASHNLSFHESFNNGIFPGDAAGTYFPEFNQVTPTTPPPFYLESSLASLDKLINLKPSVLYYSHFGKADQAVRRLRGYKAQLLMWNIIVQDAVKQNQSFEQITERVLTEDPVMKDLSSFLKSHKVYAMTAIENSVCGFVEYAKKTLSKQAS